MANILFLYPGYNPIISEPELRVQSHLSKKFKGHILQPTWELKPELSSIKSIGNFKFHNIVTYKSHSFFKMLLNFRFYIGKGLALHRQEKIDLILCYGTNSTGVSGLVLKLLTGAKLVVEVTGVPEQMVVGETPNPSLKEKLNNWLQKLALRVVGTGCDRLKLLYDAQVDCVFSRKFPARSRFFDYIAGESFLPHENNKKTIVMVGVGFYRKAVDVLIESFNKIHPEFSDYKLLVVGWDSQLEHFKSLAKDNSAIEFTGPQPAAKYISECALFVCPSRSEAMGRVILEAMACAKPIVASRVDGIPTYVSDEENGLLVEPGDVDDLAKAMARVLGDKNLAKSLGENGRKRYLSNYTEDCYVEKFSEMVREMGIED